jgi:hyperosmotically inducible protein
VSFAAAMNKCDPPSVPCAGARCATGRLSRRFRSCRRSKGIDMFTYKRLGVLAIASILSAGASAQTASEKCGSNGCPDDAKIQQQVQQKIYENSSLRSLNIYVQTVGHVVYLKGSVDTRSDRRRAAAIARTVPGVKQIYNDLALNGNGN